MSATLPITTTPPPASQAVVPAQPAAAAPNAAPQSRTTRIWNTASGARTYARGCAADAMAPGFTTRIFNKASRAWTYARDCAAGLVQPIDFRGERYGIPFFSTPFPKDPFDALTKAEARAEAFEQIQKTLPVVQPLATSASVATASPSTAAQQAAETDAELKRLSLHVSNFSILYALHWAAKKTDDANMPAMFELTQRASQAGAPSLKQLVFNHYTDLNCLRRLLIHIVYFLYTFRGLVEKTVNAYSTQILIELRLRFSQSLRSAGESQGLVPSLIDDFAAFLRVYRQAIVDHAEGKELIGLNGMVIPAPTLENYKDVAIQRLYNKSLHQLCKEVTMTVVNKLAPTIEYKQGAWILNPVMNGLVRWFLRSQLPSVMEEALQKTAEQTKPHKLPFVKAILETMIERLTDLKTTIKEGELLAPPGKFPGTENLPYLVEQLVAVLNLGENPTQAHVLARAHPQQEDPTTKEIHAAIQKSLVIALNIFLHYIAEPQNTEKMFTKLLTLFNLPFSSTQHVTQEEVDTLNGQLATLGDEVLDEVIDETVEEVIRNGPKRKAADKASDHQFEARQQALLSLSEELEKIDARLSQHFSGKTLYKPNGWALVQRELVTAKDRIRSFIPTEKRSKAGFAHLPPADQEAILRPLLPLYDKVLATMDYLVNVETNLQAYHPTLLLSADYQLVFELMSKLEASYRVGIETTTSLSQLPSGAPSQERSALLAKLRQSAEEIKAYFAQFEQISQRIQGTISADEQARFQAFLASCRLMQEHFQQLLALHALDLDIRTYLHQNGSAPKPLQLSHFSDAHRTALLPLIGALSAFNRRTGPDAQTIRSLTAQLSRMQQEILGSFAQVQGNNLAHHLRLLQLIGTRLGEQQAIQANLDRQTESAHSQLAQTIGDLRTQAAGARKEQHRHPTDNGMGAGVGALGAGLGAGLAWFFPVTSYALPALLAGTTSGAGPEAAVDYILKRPVQKDSLFWTAAHVVGSVVLTGVAAPYIGPVAASALALGIGTGVGAKTMKTRTIERARTVVKEPMTEFREKGKEFITNNHCYQAWAKIILAMIPRFYR